MKTKLNFLVSVLCFLTATTLPARANEALRAKLFDFERQALFTREIETKLQNIPNRSPYRKDNDTQRKAVLKLAREYNQKPIPEDALARDFFVYYGACLQMQAGENAPAHAAFARLVGSPTMTAEALVNYRKLDAAPEYRHLDSREKHRLFKEVLGKLLPVGYYGQAYDLANYKSITLHDPFLRFHRFDTCGSYNALGHDAWGRSGRIANALKQMKLHRWATIASLEILYANPLQNLQQARSWFDTTPMIHWDVVAKAQWQLGNDEQLAAALARVIVFGYNGIKDDALQLLARWRENGLPQEPEAAQPNTGQLKMILQLYAEMNMHPRALELLREFSAVIGPEAQELREKYESEWLEKVNFKPSQYQTYFIFGQNIDQPESRLNVVIHPPLRPEAIDEAKRMMTLISNE